MRIHLNLSDPTAAQVILDAKRAAGVYAERQTWHGSHSHTQAVDVILSGDAPHRINSSEFGDVHAASWDQWGIFLAAIYAVDPTAKSWAYEDAEDFHFQTHYRFETEHNPAAIRSTTSPGYQRTSHKWAFISPRTFQCENKRHGECTAVWSR